VNSVPRQTQLALGPLVAAVGAVLLIVSLFLDWYEGITGFTVFEFIDLLLVLLALATIASLAAGAGLFEPAPPPAVSLGVALFTIFVVLTQIINDPPMVVLTERDQDIGIWLGLSGAALMLAGAVLGYASISLAFEPRQRAGADERGRDHDVTSVSTPGATEKPKPGPGRPVASDEDPTRPLSDPASPRRWDDPARP
jgi:hypothetical protein